MSDEAPILTDLNDNGVLTVTLNRPKANAFNTEMTRLAQKIFKDAARNDSVRVVVLTGSGRLFSAGQDVTEFGGQGDRSFREHLQKTYNPLIMQIRKLERPVIGAINGTVAGAALGVALSTDLRIASEDAKFFVGFLGIGLAPDSAVSLFLPRLIGLARATEHTFSNKPISAQQALEWGLVNRLAPADDVHNQAAAWADELAKGPVRAMGLAKRDLNKAILPQLAEILDYEAHNQEIAGRGPEAAEGIAAFLEKREARYLDV